jgi:hypothetical protein
LNAAIRPLIVELNERPFQKLPGSRRSVFEALDRPAMRVNGCVDPHFFGGEVRI